MKVGNRIAVVGCPGSGKSTFSVSLGRCTGLPVIHLDTIWWRKDRTHITREEFDGILAEILTKDRWIIDGDYSRTWEKRICAADTVVLDIIDGIPFRVETDAGLSQAAVEGPVKIDVTLQRPVPVVRKDPLLSGQEIPDHHVRIAAPVAQEVDPPVIPAQGRARKIQKLGVPAVTVGAAADQHLTVLRGSFLRTVHRPFSSL